MNQLSKKILPVRMKPILLLLISLTIFGKSLNAQEYLSGLSENPIVRSEYLKHLPDRAASVSDTLSLPFFDDFSSSRVYPRQDRWINRMAFINNSYGLGAPSIGVATLDAVDFDGKIYENASASAFEADELTSSPIDLNGLQDADSLYFSFFYQAQGLGDNPEYNDSLWLEFYSAESQEWYWMWGSKGKSLHDFEQVLIRIPDTAVDGSAFRLKGFQFRFKNMASLAGLTEQSFASNADHWHLDYIYLDTGRTAADTVLIDLAFLSEPTRLLKDYTSMPYRHFSINASQLTDKYSLHFSNHRDNSMVVAFQLKVFNMLDGGSPIDIVPGGSASDNFQPGDTLYQNNLSSNPFLGSSNPVKGLFKMQGIIKPGEAVADFSAENDTAEYFQIFDNYYAYDDGSAESGYGISGDGSQNAMLAYRFKNFLPGDSLRGMQMYFNRTMGNANIDYFYLMVWAHDPLTNGPGDLIFSQIGALPVFGDSLHQFRTYRFLNSLGEDTAILTPDTFYVGWKQTTADLLNVGFDRNNLRNFNSENDWLNPSIYYNISGGWQASAFQGALMIRPVFQFEGPLLGTNLPQLEFNLSLYPNPTDGYLNVGLSPDYPSFIYEICDLQGRILIKGSQENSSGMLDLTNLEPGIYIFIANIANQKITRKVIIQ